MPRKPNYSFEKRQRERARQEKRTARLERKRAAKEAADGVAPEAGTDQPAEDELTEPVVSNDA